MKSNVKPRIALFWDLVGALARQIASFIVAVFLARVLSPEDFGTIGLAMVFISISEVFVDVGFTDGLIQKKSPSDLAFSSVFFVNLIISLTISGVMCVFASVIAKFYNDPEIEDILYFLAVIPPLAAMGRVHAVKLMRSMNFKSLSKRDVVATIFGGLVGVCGAFSGFGVFSLVAQQISMVITSTLLLWISVRWRPKLQFSFVEVRQLIGYSGYVFFDQLLRQIFNKVDTIFIGKYFSPTVLGFYSRAESLKAQVDSYTTNSLRKVIFPLLSTLQDDTVNFQSTFKRVFKIVSGSVVIIVAPLYFLSEEIVVGLFGKNWIDSVPIFKVLVLSILITPQVGMMGKAVLAKGYSRLKFIIGLVQRILKLAPILFGFYYGLLELTYAVVVSSVLVFLIYLLFVNYYLNIKSQELLIDTLKVNLPFILISVLVHISGLDNANLIIVLLFLSSYLIYLHVLNHESITFIKKILRQIVNRFV